jgi:hypothetical protein
VYETGIVVAMIAAPLVVKGLAQGLSLWPEDNPRP